MIPSSYKSIQGESPIKQTNRQWLLQQVKGIDRSFVVSKLFYFFFYTALGALFPFFSLYYKQLWLSPSEIGLLLAIRPTIKLFCLPLWTMVTGHYSKPKAVYFISIFGWLIGYYGQTFVSPENFQCYLKQSLVSNVQPNYSLPLSASLITAPKQDWSSMDKQLDSVPLYTKNKVVNNFLQGKRFFKRDVSHMRDIPRKTGTQLTTPLRLDGQAASKHRTSRGTSQRKLYKMVHHLNKMFDNSRDSAQVSGSEGINEQGENHIPQEKLSQNLQGLTDSSQDRLRGGESVQFLKKMANDDTGKMAVFNENPSKSPKPEDDFRIRYNYWIVRTLAVIIILTEIITTPTPLLADSAVIQSIANTTHDYGNQRLFGSLGLALAAALVAVWVSFTTDCPFTDTINYIPCFNIFIIAIAATIFVSLFFKFDAPSQDREEYKLLEAFKVFKTPRYGFFLFTMFALGFAHSLQIGFLFWFLQDLGGNPVLFAIIILVYCISDVVLYFVMGYIIEAIGQQRTLSIAIACYVIRFLMYGHLEHPWLVIPMEMVQGMTYGGVWSVAGMYIEAPQESAKAIQSILHGAYWGVGMAIGALVSGFVIEACGAQKLFLAMSLVMASLCLVHLFIFLADRVEELNKDQEVKDLSTADSRRRHKGRGKQHENFIGAAAAPLVPCLLYGN